MEQLRERDPEMFELMQQEQELDRRTHQLADEFRRLGETDAREKIRAELTEVTGQQFDARQKRRELELRRMTEQLERLKASISSRAEHRQEIVERRVSQLLGEEDELGF